MTIDRVNISNVGVDRAQGTQPSDSTRHSGKDQNIPVGSDSVELSSKAKELDRLASAIGESCVERFNKVSEALESGTYRVAARDIAQKLIDANKK
jgi:flagellar biosynthesis anti-sigma factor FlgM